MKSMSSLTAVDSLLAIECPRYKTAREELRTSFDL
jgi:hypothetical protein